MCNHVLTMRHGDMETWRHGDMETWRHGNMRLLGNELVLD